MSQYIVKSAVSDKSQAMFFPAREKELQSYCDNLGIVNDMKSKVVVLEIMPDRRLTGLLTEREYNLSELNLFATVYDALNKYEKDIFFAVVEAKKYDTLFDFINLCCNTDCYGLVDDFSDLDAIGKKIYLNEVGMNPEQELARFNGEAFIMGIMEHNPPLITSHGIIYQNNNFEKKVYNGKCFPSLDTNKPITLCLNTKLDRDFLYLPCEQSEVDKAFERLNVDSFSDVSLEVDDYDLPKNIADIVLADLTDFEKLNSIAKTLDEVGKHEHGHLSQLVEFTKITEVEELEVLSSCMFEFEVLPDIYDDYQYGYHIIAESGRFDYDETLEEYIDFERYGRERNSMNDSIYTEKGYLNYLGYNQDMCNILNKNLGMNLEVEPEHGFEMELPASYEHIEDVFDKLGTRENINADCDIAFDFGAFVDTIELENVDLFELNHLAERIQNFYLVEAFELEGAVLKLRDTNLSVGDLINIVENIKEGNIEAYPAANITELAETYIDFAMIPEIADLQKGANSWVLEHLDYEKVGENIRQKTGGVFAGQAFVVVGELEKLYSGD